MLHPASDPAQTETRRYTHLNTAAEAMIITLSYELHHLDLHLFPATSPIHTHPDLKNLDCQEGLMITDDLATIYQSFKTNLYAQYDELHSSFLTGVAETVGLIDKIPERVELFREAEHYMGQVWHALRHALELASFGYTTNLVTGKEERVHPREQAEALRKYLEQDLVKYFQHLSQELLEIAKVLNKGEAGAPLVILGGLAVLVAAAPILATGAVVATGALTLAEGAIALGTISATAGAVTQELELIQKHIREAKTELELGTLLSKMFLHGLEEGVKGVLEALTGKLLCKLLVAALARRLSFAVEYGSRAYKALNFFVTQAAERGDSWLVGSVKEVFASYLHRSVDVPTAAHQLAEHIVATNPQEWAHAVASCKTA